MKAIIPAQDKPHFASATGVKDLSERLSLIDLPAPEPAALQVRIKVEVTAVNPADVLQSRGAYPAPPGATRILGIECSGVIDKVGAGVRSLPDCEWIEEGVLACALLEGGGYGEYVIVDAQLVMPLPPLPAAIVAELAHEHALSNRAIARHVGAMGLVESAAASWMVLESITKLFSQPERTVLIHGASGAVGSIAVQLARSWGNSVYATAGSSDRCARVQKLGATRCFDYHDNWVEQLLTSTPAGMDVVMDVLGGGGLRNNIQALAKYGHIVVIGLLGGAEGELNLGDLLAKNASITAQTLRSQNAKRKAGIVRMVRTQVWPLVATHQVKPVIGRVYKIDEIANAHREIAKRGGQVFGKIAVTL